MTTSTLKKRVFRLPMLLAVGALALGLAGCGLEHRTNAADVSQDDLSAGGEPYFFDAGVTYQVQISRQLNPYNPIDVQYLSGVQGAQDLAADQLWYGVFLWAKNQNQVAKTTADTFKIVDSAGDVFSATKLNPSLNPYAWTAQKLTPNQIEPMADTTASNGSAGGGLVLFKLTQAVYSNRPLTLEVFAPGHSKPSKVSLDL